MKKNNYFVLIFCLLIPFVTFSQTEQTERNQKYTPCELAKYPDNMTMVVQVKADGWVLADCEVAVVDAQGECRESSLSIIEHEGRCYLTIQGEEREELSFRVVYHVNGEQFDVMAAEQVTFEVDAALGNYAKPYVLTIPAVSSVAQQVCATPRVQPVQGGLWLAASEPHTFRITSLSGWNHTQTVFGETFVSLPPGVYVVDRSKYMVR